MDDIAEALYFRGAYPQAIMICNLGIEFFNRAGYTESVCASQSVSILVLEGSASYSVYGCIALPSNNRRQCSSYVQIGRSRTRIHTIDAVLRTLWAV